MSDIIKSLEWWIHEYEKAEHRIAELERKLKETEPVLKAALRQAVVGWEVPPCLSGEVYRLWLVEWTARYLKVCGETDAAIGYDAARAAWEDSGDPCPIVDQFPDGEER